MNPTRDGKPSLVREAFLANALLDPDLRAQLNYRLWRITDIKGPNECWLCKGCGKYPVIEFKGHNLRAHRLSYALHNGPVPHGLFVCHHCDVKNCVNPAHLFAGSASDNAWDSAKKGKNPMTLNPDLSPFKKHWLTDSDKQRMCDLRAKGVLLKVIGAEFGMSDTHAKMVMRQFLGQTKTLRASARKALSEAPPQ